MSETRQRVFYEGLVTGLIGYVTVALVLAITDLAMGEPLFYTVATLGHAVYGAGPEGAGVTPAAVFAYNGVHLLAFVAIGMLVAWLIVETELHPVIWYVAFMVLIGVLFLATVLLAGAAEGLAQLAWWRIVLANGIAALAMGTYVLRAHPRLLRDVARHGDPETDT